MSNQIRNIIKESLNELTIKKYVSYCSALLRKKFPEGFSEDKEYDIIYEIRAIFLKHLNIDFIGNNADLMDRVCSAYIEAQTFDSDKINIDLPKKSFDIEITQKWSGYGTDWLEGVIETYNETYARFLLEEEGEYHDYVELKDRDFANYETDEVDLDLTPTKKENKKLYESKNEEDGEGFDRVKYYLEYYSNLTPSGFDICKKGDEIIITIPQKSKL